MFENHQRNEICGQVDLIFLMTSHMEDFCHSMDADVTSSQRLCLKCDGSLQQIDLCCQTFWTVSVWKSRRATRNLDS